jgi:hypothetical protein
MRNLAVIPTTTGSTESIARLVDCKTQSPEDREMREQLHQHRYLLFQHGVTIREIAESEDVEERQIYLSISHCETRLLKAEVMANRNFRNAMVTQRKVAEKYAATLMDLMDGKGGKNWHQRSKALEHFRRTVGAEAGAGMNLHVTQQVAVVNSDRPTSFEQAMDVVRRRLNEDRNKVAAVATDGTPEFEAQLVPDDDGL